MKVAVTDTLSASSAYKKADYTFTYDSQDRILETHMVSRSATYSQSWTNIFSGAQLIGQTTEYNSSVYQIQRYHYNDHGLPSSIVFESFYPNPNTIVYKDSICYTYDLSDNINKSSQYYFSNDGHIGDSLVTEITIRRLLESSLPLSVSYKRIGGLTSFFDFTGHFFYPPRISSDARIQKSINACVAYRNYGATTWTHVDQAGSIGALFYLVSDLTMQDAPNPYQEEVVNIGDRTEYKIKLIPSGVFSHYGTQQTVVTVRRR